MADTSATAHVKEILKQYGLENLTDWALGELIDGYDDVTVLQHLREQPETKARFAAVYEREKLGLPPISFADVINYEKAATELMVSAGMPRGFYDSPEDFTNLMVGDVSVQELQKRVEGGYARVAQAPAEVRQSFRDLFGADGDAALATFFLDPEKAQPLLETQLGMAQIHGTGRRYGIDTGKDLAEQLARQDVSQQEAEQQFATLARGRGLFNENVDETARNLSVDKEGVEAAFGTDQEARANVERRAASRQAAFQGSGGAQTTQKGYTGLGSAGRP